MMKFPIFLALFLMPSDSLLLHPISSQRWTSAKSLPTSCRFPDAILLSVQAREGESKKNWICQLQHSIRSALGCLLFVSSMALLTPQNAFGRSSRAKLDDISSSSSTQLLNGKMGQNSDQNNVEVEVQIVDANKKFTRLGFGMAGATILISVLTSDDKKSKGKPRNEHTEFKKTIDLNKGSSQPLRPDIEVPQLIVDASVLPNDDASKGMSYPVTRIVRKRREMAAVRDSATIQTENEDSSVENPGNVSPHVEKVGTVVASNLPPPAAKRTPGLLGRIFQKPGAGRLTDIREVLKQTDTASDFRHVVVEILLLTSSMPKDLFLEANVPMGSSVVGKNDSQDPEKLSTCLDEVQGISLLNDQQAANAYAEVVSAMLVVLVDHAVEISNIDANETATVGALDLVSEFMKAASDIFGRKFNGTKIDPVQYNGKAKKGQLEHLYYVFAKTMTFESLLPFAGFGSPLESSTETNIKKSTVEEKMTFIQQAFAIKVCYDRSSTNAQCYCHLSRRTSV